MPASGLLEGDERTHYNDIRRVLSGMREGVVAVDSQRRITVINSAACSILGVQEGAFRGQSFSSVVASPDAQQLLETVFSTARPVEADLTLADSSVIVGTYGRPLLDDSGVLVGALIRLNDVTQLRRLERVRQDFVANVSHELKTPVTAIKGFVETLLAGAMRDSVHAERFLSIVLRQVDRLAAIISDLLLLSTVDDDAPRADISFEFADARDSARSAIEVCSLRAAEKSVRIELVADGEMRAMINASLLEQAISNLVANAVYYSDPHTSVTVKLWQTAQELHIAVIDQGCGIAPEHLPRIFERFYRVDKSRARKAGGTGLGLAIVKHISQVHRGRVDVVSNLGKGSTFTISIPISSAQQRQ